MFENGKDRELPPEAVIMQMLMGKWISRAITVAAELRIADYLKDEPRHWFEVAKEVGAHPDALYRVMRALSVMGVFIEGTDGKFSLTQIGNCLCTNRHGSAHPMALWINHDSALQPWGKMLYSVKTGKPAFNHVFNMDLFEYMKKYSDAAKIFNDAMTGTSAHGAHAVIDAYNFSQVDMIIDVGGGQGMLLSFILEKHPQIKKGILFDLPHVVNGVKPLMTKQSVIARYETVGGDFFEGVPIGGDIYLLKHIIHDWDDEHALKILKNCQRAMNDNGKILLVEMVVPPPGQPDISKLIDLEMLVMTPSGRERTEAEYDKLFQLSGLNLSRIISTESPVSIVEAVCS